MKFDMGAQTLSNLVRDTRGSSDDLGSLVRQLVQAAQPLEGKFNGTGRAMFDQFKARADQIASELNSSLSAILGGQSGMDSAFGTGDQEQGDNARQQMAAANFDAARFR
ncbi:hypothetical protein ACFOOM_06000 [Streptomyces echinoruber]|uniref:WXG100 family type VII secretion target n=1 Tax=Streptomyces echinoruber TaxID=68898 RepID=A0A918RRI7_9ACTN|nr:hypothetical protein [Streptomyces echinoruber]GGZ78025.1 hypothetical protein GCM10010389_14410 [Streptomyces echinoruber]GHA10405.1 hypothetical protein GCM10010389_56850 [Streptomyces echinoruber]